MLLRFRVRNFASLRDEQEMSLVGAEKSSRGTPVPGTDLSALPVAAIYGSNASGKSNVIKAFRFALDTIRDSHQRWLPEQQIPRWPFRLDTSSLNNPSEFVFEFLMNEVRYEYGFSLDDSRITGEWLYAWPRGKRQMLLQRDGDSLDFGRALGGNKAAIRELVRANSLFLSAAAANNHDLLGRISHYFSPNGKRVHERSYGHEERQRRFNRIVRYASRDPQLMDLIRYADLGIVGAVEDAPDTASPATTLDDSRLEQIMASFLAAQGPSVTWLHEAGSDAVSLPASWESYGTIEWMFLVNNALSMLRAGGTLLVDDLGGDLHPTLVAQLVKLFLEPATNQRGAQLIFNTHDVSLLWRGSEARLSRDQIWFTKKSKDGATTLYPLTDFRVRDTVDDFMGRYLHGRFEGIPFFEDELLDSLRKGAMP